MRPTTMNEIPSPCRGFGTSLYCIFSRIAPIDTIASTHPSPHGDGVHRVKAERVFSLIGYTKMDLTAGQQSKYEEVLAKKTLSGYNYGH